MFPNLRAEMSRYGVSKDDIATCLDVNEKTARDKLAGKYYFNIMEMKKIKTKFFPTMTLDYIFSEDKFIKM
jgi:hypothetical protein